ncbi:hypothetical protein Hanom_Chr06g00508201 [Helianthus anomalus]
MKAERKDVYCEVVFVEVKKQTLFSLKTADLWSTSSPADACRCGPQTTDFLHLKKQTPPKFSYRWKCPSDITSLAATRY